MSITLNRIAPILALVGIPMSIWDLGMYGDLWALLFCWFCIFILFWWYLANVVFATSKKERRNMAFKNVTGKRKRPPQRTTNLKITHSQNNTHHRRNQ